jgi:thiamine biosynthesis lipoprotein ApbE
MDLRKRYSLLWLACFLTVCGCGGTAENSVTPPTESNFVTQGEAMRKNYATQSNQEEIDKAIEAAKKNAN